MKYVYLLGAIAGALLPWYFNVLTFTEGPPFTPVGFFMQGFEGPPMLGSLAADFWVGATVSTVWMIAEGRRLRMKWLPAYIVWALLVASASALPLFLFMRERHLEERA
ncbi:MAG: DUF2834 domain-containing protein [Sandaracinaceae bacterium]